MKKDTKVIVWLTNKKDKAKVKQVIQEALYYQDIIGEWEIDVK
jgi:hypothetical protein